MKQNPKLNIVWSTTKTLPREGSPTKLSESVRSTLMKGTTNMPTATVRELQRYITGVAKNVNRTWPCTCHIRVYMS